MELIEDSAADIFGILSEAIAETRAMDEDAEFTNGDGQGRPLGILQAGLTTVNSGDANTFTYAGLTSLWATLRAQYRQNATWMMNSLSFGEILAVEDTGNTLIFPPNALPGTLFNRPVAFNEFMPDPDAGNVAVVFGDFRFYVIADRMELKIQRLDERAAPNVALLPFARLGGQTVRTNAFRTQTIST
jgi:HK97 family phage major capsid protein